MCCLSLGSTERFYAETETEDDLLPLRRRERELEAGVLQGLPDRVYAGMAIRTRVREARGCGAMQPIVTVGETRPGGPMDRLYVTVPYATWLTLENAGKREADLLAQLAEEKRRTAAVLADYQAYMRANQVLKTLERRRA